jgi:hypothetical protein
MTAIDEAIERLYAAFADQPKPRVIEGCPCCIDNKNIHVLLSTPIRAITSNDLSRYSFSAFLTVGSVHDYLYFLPRIFEIAAVDESPWPDPEVNGRAIRSAAPMEWPPRRLAALKEFLTAIVQSAIDAGDYEKLDSWLCAIARMGLDVAPYLKQVEQSREAVLGYFAANSKKLQEGRLVNAYWELPNAGHDAIVEWFYSDSISAIPAEEWGVCLKHTT